ncbi:MAG: hypothetical protein EOP51_33260, partial [Sphingobacteriales bacterium]
MKKLYSITHLKRLSLLLIVFLFAQLQVSAQLVVTAPSSTSTFSPAMQLARMLVGQGVTVSNAQLSGAPVSYGKFNGVNSNIGLDSGVLLTTGRALHAIGPNNSSGSTAFDDNGDMIGDPQLTALAELNTSSTNPVTRDATILEFDMQVAADTLRFQYVFASEEYLTYACSIYDIFGFFISGPGIAGGVGVPGNVPGFPTVRNIALLPNGDPVSIGTIRPTGLGCTASYPQFYVDNGTGSTPAINTTIQYNGFSTVLTAEIYGLTPCETYHLRLAVADVSDNILDTGVFIKAGSLSSTGVIFSGTTNVSYAGYADLLEGTNGVVGEPSCVTGGFAIKRYGDLTDAKTVSFALGGTATNGWDYTDANLMPLDSV